MPQEYKDASFSLNTGIEGQVYPSVLMSVEGTLTTANLNIVTSLSGGPQFQLSTQDNNVAGLVAQANNYAWQTTVSGPVYSSPGNHLNNGP